MDERKKTSYELEREKLDLERERLDLERERLRSLQKRLHSEAESNTPEHRTPGVPLLVVLGGLALAFLSGAYIGSYIETSRTDRTRQLRREALLKTLSAGHSLTNSPFAALPSGEWNIERREPPERPGTVFLIME
ncbi:MAG: hypothetical protein ACI4X9_07765 [Kiritimatiellia bacterium]